VSTRRKIQSLVGEELSAVSFVRDYVEFHFDGPVFRAMVGPIVTQGYISIAFPEPGSRDALCELIGLAVREVVVQKDIAIELRFAGGQVVRVPLDEASRTGPEAAHFMGEHIHSPLDVW
jgi:hypothetical protein